MIEGRGAEVEAGSQRLVVHVVDSILHDVDACDIQSGRKHLFLEVGDKGCGSTASICYLIGRL